MAVLKYKDEDGFWQELQVGTKVVANPGGGTKNLTTLTVGATTYNIPDTSNLSTFSVEVW